MERLIIDLKDLPKLLEIKGEGTESKLYQIRPAGRKFGACLNAIDENHKELLKSIK